jgi:hypothetical protein
VSGKTGRIFPVSENKFLATLGRVGLPGTAAPAGTKKASSGQLSA